MRMDLDKKVYRSEEEYREYIYGSADVVGLMCLRVFVKGDDERYEQLRVSAMALGSAFQKVNFLRDLKADFDGLDRTYFPNTNLLELNEDSKALIVADIQEDFKMGYQGIVKLPSESNLGYLWRIGITIDCCRNCVKHRQWKLEIPVFEFRTMRR
jgi:hypothetical protein